MSLTIPLSHSITDYAIALSQGDDGAAALAECRRLAPQLIDNIYFPGYGFYDSALLTHAIHQNIPDDVCFVLIAKGYRVEFQTILVFPTSTALILAVLARHPHFYKDGNIILIPFDLRSLLFRDDAIFDLFAKWGRITLSGNDTPLEFALRLRGERRRYDADSNFFNGTYVEESTPKSFPRLRLLRLIPDYDNFVNVIVDWRRHSNVDVGGVYRKIWEYLVGGLKF
jgi:hypothetical protein